MQFQKHFKKYASKLNKLQYFDRNYVMQCLCRILEEVWSLNSIATNHKIKSDMNVPIFLTVLIR